MKTKILFYLLVTLSVFSAAGEPAWWTQQKIDCGLPSSLAYNDWIAEGSPCNKGNSSTAAPSIPSAPAGFTPQQQLGMQVGMMGAYMVGQGLHDLMWGSQQDQAQQQAQQQAQLEAQLEAQREQQQRLANAQQFNNTGLFLLRQKNYSGAINEFQQALAQTPGDPNIIKNIALAKQKIKDTAVAAKNSGALSQLLGNTPADSGKFDFDQLTHSSLPSPNSSALNLVNLDSDPNVVDLRGTTKIYVDPALVKNDSASKPADAQQALKDLNNLLDNSADQAKKQLDDFANNYLPHAPDVTSTKSVTDAQSGIQNQKSDVEQTTKELDQALGQSSSADVQQPAETTSANRTINLGNAGNPDFDGNAGGNGAITGNGGSSPATQSSSVVAGASQPTGGQSDIVTPGENLKDAPIDNQSGQKIVNMSGVASADAGLTPVASSSASLGTTDTKASDQLLSAAAGGQNSGQNFDTGGGNAGSLKMPGGGGTGYSGGSVVALAANQGIVDPSTLKGSLPDPALIAPGTPVFVTRSGGGGPPKNIYQKIMGYAGPVADSIPIIPQGYSNAKLASRRDVTDALYASGCSYTTNGCPLGYEILRVFTLAHDGTEAVLYGQMDDAGNPVNLILAFRGTDDLNSWTYGNFPNGVPPLTQILSSYSDAVKDLGISVTLLAQKNNSGKSEAYVASVLIASLVQKAFPGVPITLTGHSLGGGEAALASVATGIPAITFNAAGDNPGDYGYSPAAGTLHITNYRVAGEPLTYTQEHLTTTTGSVLPSAMGTKLLPVALGTQIDVPAVTGRTVGNALNHGMSAVEPAMISFLSQ